MGKVQQHSRALTCPECAVSQFVSPDLWDFEQPIQTKLSAASLVITALVIYSDLELTILSLLLPSLVPRLYLRAFNSDQSALKTRYHFGLSMSTNCR